MLCCPVLYCAVQGPVRQLAGGLGSSGQHLERSDSPDDDLAARGTLAEVTVVLRWERLVGRLAAAAAQRKALMLLQWLQLHLAFTEGCSSRGMWLSQKVACVLCSVSHLHTAGAQHKSSLTLTM